MDLILEQHIINITVKYKFKDMLVVPKQFITTDIYLWTVLEQIQKQMSHFWSVCAEIIMSGAWMHCPFPPLKWLTKKHASVSLDPEHNFPTEQLWKEIAYINNKFIVKCPEQDLYLTSWPSRTYFSYPFQLSGPHFKQNTSILLYI